MLMLYHYGNDQKCFSIQYYSEGRCFIKHGKHIFISYYLSYCDFILFLYNCSIFQNKFYQYTYFLAYMNEFAENGNFSRKIMLKLIENSLQILDDV